MTTGILIIGKDETGKTSLAKLLAEKYNKKEILFTQGRFFKEDNFFFLNEFIKGTTKCLIIDDVPASTSIESFYKFFNDFWVHKMAEMPFQATIETIIVTYSDFNTEILQCKSFKRRFNVVETISNIHKP